jgi:DNA-binding HxlR family transcriptional regulator
MNSWKVLSAFLELETQLEITNRMLSERLKQLEEADTLKRLVTPETLVKIEYVLTQKGYSLKPVMESLQQWSNTWY